MIFCFYMYSNYSSITGAPIKVAIVYGGTHVNHQREMLRFGGHILVATPGRLMHFEREGLINFSNCNYLVLDEADRMLDMGFEPEVRKSLKFFYWDENDIGIEYAMPP